jgi:hypothetical protein
MSFTPALVWTGDAALIYDMDYRIFYHITHPPFSIMCLSFVDDGKLTHYCTYSFFLQQLFGG